MQLANLRNIKFSNFSFYQYFFTAYVGLHVTFSILLGNITAFASDEGLYNKIFSQIYSPNFTSEVMGFTGSWEPWLRAIYLPAKLLTYTGISDLIASRLLAIGYSTLATYLLVKIARSNERDDRIFKVALIVISFLPTVFLWSSVGLRESFLYLEICSILFFLSRVKEHLDIKNMAGLGFAIFSLAMTKNYIFILFLFAFIITLIVFSVKMRANFLNHILILVLALSPLAVNPTLVPAISGYFSGQLAKPESSIVGDINNDGRCDSLDLCGSETIGNIDEPNQKLGNVATGGMTIHLLLNQLENSPNTIAARLAKSFGITSKLSAIVKSSVVVETSKLVIENQKKLSLKQAGLKHPDQMISSSLRFLFVPIIFVDNGSLFLNIQSIETPLWLFIYGLFFIGLFQLIRRRRELDYAVLMATLFALEFVAISALTEINVGTALRHRSLLLIPILVIWLARKKTEVKKIN